MNTPGIHERVAGGLIGAAVGDALGAPMEWMHYRHILDQFGDFQGFADLESVGAHGEGLGLVTDDTVLSDLLVDCIIRHDGIIDAHLFAREWEDLETPVPNPDGEPIVRLNRIHWIERIPYFRNRLREIPKRELGHGEANATNAVMYIAPVGLLCAGDPLKAALMAADITAVNQHGRSRDVAAGYAAAVAQCFVPDATVDSIVETGIQFTRDHGHTREITAMVALARQCRDCDEFIRRYYEDILGRMIPFQGLQHEGQTYGDAKAPACVSWNSAEILGPTLATLLITRGDSPAQMILACAKIGRDADTIARCAGGLIGAYRGVSAIPEEWREYVLRRNRWLRLEEKARRLADIVSRRLADTCRASQRLLGSPATE